MSGRQCCDQIKELLLADGDSPFAEWFESLEAVAAAKVRVAVSRMEQGNLSNVEWCRPSRWAISLPLATTPSSSNCCP